MRVGLLFGGRSGEHEVSLASAMSVYSALDKSRYDVTMIAIDKDGRWLLPDPKPLLAHAENPMLVKFSRDSETFGLVPYPSQKQLVPVELGGRANSPLPSLDVVLPILHGSFGEDGTIQGLLELAGIPYVGSGVLGSSVGMDKDVASRLFTLAGIATVPSLTLRKHDFKRAPKEVMEKLLQQFAFPFFVKPANAGSSVGVHKIKKREDLAPALEDAFSFDTKLLVQKAVDARELEVAVLGNSEPRASVVGEIVPKHEFYSYEAKYIDENGAELHFPAKNVSPEVAKKVQTWAVEAFKTIECRGMARVDFFLDRKTGELFINEINTIPGFTKISMYPKLWEASGISYVQLLDELIRLALENFAERSSLRTSYDVKDWEK
ncbi:MAG: D-alanine--D-alanine ligase [Bdellovibrionales bacterium]|nr:D-alanine--D-alanine ligase [Bdellovibrionales bacterium]